MLRGGTPPGEVAVVFRDPARYASLVEQVFGAYGIPYSIDRSVPLAHTGVGRGLLALLRCALLEGTADDLLAYLRTPGLLRRPRAGGPAGGRRAPRRGRRRRRRAGRLGGDRRPLAAGGARPAGARRRRCARCWRARAVAWSGCSRRPIGARRTCCRARSWTTPRAFLAAQEALAELRAVVGADPGSRSTPGSVHDTLAELPVRVGESPQPDRVQVASPLRGPRAPLPGGVRLRAPGDASSRAGRPRSRSCPTPTGARSRGGGLRAAAARGPAGARALPVLRVRLARRAPAGAELAHLRRGGQPQTRPRSSWTTSGRCSPTWRTTRASARWRT